MRIIKQGKLADEALHRHTCRHCATEFEFQRKEADYISDPRDGDCLKVDCPGCHRPLYVGIAATSYQGPG